MKNFTAFYTPRLAVIFSIFIGCYWLLQAFFNPYDYALVGAVYELLWLPMIVALFAIPVISIVVIIFEKFKLKLGYVLSILIPITTFIILNNK